MFVSVARVTLQIPDAGSLKAKRQVLRRVTDRVKARFNASVAEVDDHDLWQKAQVAVAVIASDKRHAQEQVDKILHFIEELYVAPVISREVETVAFGRDLYGGGSKPDVDAADRERDEEADPGASLDLGALGLRGDRSLAEVEGLGAWHERHEAGAGPAPSGPGSRGQTSSGKAGRGKGMSDDDVRARARALRNRRDWEKK